MLHGDGASSLVDFDLCHAEEVTAEAAYLGGCADLRALPDRHRLRWFRTEAVAERLLACLRKDHAQWPRLAQLLPQIKDRRLT